MLGELAAIGTAFCWSLTAVFFSYSGRKIGSDVVNRSRLIFALMFLAVMHLLLEGSLYPQDVDALPLVVVGRFRHFGAGVGRYLPF